MRSLERAVHLLALLALVLLPAVVQPSLLPTRRSPMTMKKVTPNMTVDDVNATVAFYRDVLGFDLVMSVPETGALDFAMMHRDGVDIMFQSRASVVADLPALSDLPRGGGLMLYIDLDGVDELFAQIHDRVTVVKGLEATFYGTREFTIRDPNGFMLTFAEDGNEGD